MSTFFRSRILILALILFALTISSANATLITKRNFTLDTDTNLISGNGLYWKRWDQTVDLSIDEALNLYSSDGWRLASSNEMVGLFNVFFSDYDWNTALDENSGRGEYVRINNYKDLISIFGVSIDAFGGISDILFGNDEDNDGFYRTAFAQYTDSDPVAGIGPDNSRVDVNYTISGYSVQLVKQISVNAPPGIYLLLPFFYFIMRRYS